MHVTRLAVKLLIYRRRRSVGSTAGTPIKTGVPSIIEMAKKKITIFAFDE
jgi:hypothetical protein